MNVKLVALQMGLHCNELYACNECDASNILIFNYVVNINSVQCAQHERTDTEK